MKRYTKENKGLLFLFIVLVGLMFANGYLFVSMAYSSARLFMIAIIGITLIVDIDKAYYVAAFCFPLASILKLSTSSISVLPFLYLIILVKLYIKKKVKINVYSLIFFFLFACVQLFSTIAYGSSIVTIISRLLNVVFVMLSSTYFINYGEANKQIKNATLFYISGVILDIVLADLFPRIPYIVSAVKQTALETNDRFAAVNVDPNEYAQLVLVGIGLLFAVLPIMKSKLGKLLDIAAIVYLCISGYRSFSKSYVIALLIMFVIVMLIYLVTTLKEKGIAVAILKFVPIVVIAVVGVVLMYERVVVPVFEAREADDLLTGRDYIWQEYINALKQRIDILIIGCGAGNETYLDRYSSLQGSATHNTYLEFLIQNGIMGLILLFVSWKDVLKNIAKTKLTNYMVLPLAAFLITAFGISANANDCLFIVLVLMSMPYEEKNRLNRSTRRRQA